MKNTYTQKSMQIPITEKNSQTNLVVKVLSAKNIYNDAGTALRPHTIPPDARAH